jgi:hypothetical protein
MSRQKRSRRASGLPAGFTKCDLPFGPIYDKKTLDRKDSFVDRGLNKAGTMVLMGDRETYLIGHINQLAGCCDDCKAFDPETRVLGYKMVVECKTEKEEND